MLQIRSGVNTLARGVVQKNAAPAQKKSTRSFRSSAVSRNSTAKTAAKAGAGTFLVAADLILRARAVLKSYLFTLATHLHTTRKVDLVSDAFHTASYSAQRSKYDTSKSLLR